MFRGANSSEKKWGARRLSSCVPFSLPQYFFRSALTTFSLNIRSASARFLLAPALELDRVSTDRCPCEESAEERSGAETGLRATELHLYADLVGNAAGSVLAIDRAEDESCSRRVPLSEGQEDVSFIPV